jgi:hypothetical protein
MDYSNAIMIDPRELRSLRRREANMKPLKIAFSGAHGTGKTTAARSLVKLLRKEGYGGTLVAATARYCPFPINREATPEAQKWIWDRQVEAEAEAMSHGERQGLEFVVCDRTIMDSLCYTFWHREKARALEGWTRSDPGKATPITAWDWIRDKTNEFVKEHLRGYDLIWLTKPDRRPLKEDGVRDADKGWQTEIAEIFGNSWHSLKEFIDHCTDKPLPAKTFRGAGKSAEDVLALLKAEKE